MKQKWSLDKNNFIITDRDKLMLNQLPAHCQTMIYTDFLFKEFLSKFSLFFNFKKEVLDFNLMEVDNKVNGTVRPRRNILKYPFYTYENDMYSEMMINLMNSLEVRIYKKDSVIARELDDCAELLFVEKGTYKVGYEINNKLFFRRCFGMCSKIGGFEICYKMRFMFYYKVSKPLRCLAIRKWNFLKLIEDYPLIAP